MKTLKTSLQSFTQLTMLALVAIGFTVMPFTPAFDFVGGVPTAEAATNIFGPNSATVATSTPYDSGEVDISNYNNVTFSFSYDSSELDGNADDQFSYEFFVDENSASSSIIEGEANTSGETGNISFDSNTLDGASSTRLKVTVSADTATDVVELTTITVSGDKVKPVQIVGGGGYDTIQKAIEAASDEGDTINIAAGTYVEEDINVNKNNLTIKGSQAGISGTEEGRGSGETVIAGNDVDGYNEYDGREGRIVVSANGVTIDGLYFDVDPGYSANNAGVVRVEGDDATLSNLVFDVGDEVVNVSHEVIVTGNNATIENSLIERYEGNSGASGVDVRGTQKVTITGSTFSYAYIGVQTADNSAITITGNSITSPSGQDAIFITGPDLAPIPSSVTLDISDNGALAWIDDTEPGFRFYTNTITRILENYASAEEVVNVMAGTYEENVTVDKSLTFNGAQAGVSAKDGARNTADSTTESVIAGTVSISVPNVVVDGFVIDNDDSSNGIDLKGGHTDFQILNNVIRDNGRGLNYSSSAVDDSTNALVSGNAFVNNDQGSQGNGIMVQQGVATKLTISDNYFTGHTAGGDSSAINFTNNASIGDHEDIEILNNIFEQESSLVFARVNHLTIQGNEHEMTDEDSSTAVYFAGDVHNVTFEENTFNGTNRDNNEGRGIKLEAEGIWGISGGFSDFTIKQNNIINYPAEDVSIADGRYDGTLNITHNYWGGNAPNLAGDDDVTYDPYYINAGRTTLSDDPDVNISEPAAVDVSGKATTTISDGGSITFDFSGSNATPNSVTVVESSGPTGDADTDAGDSNTIYLDISADVDVSGDVTISVNVATSRLSNPALATLNHFTDADGDGNKEWVELETDVSTNGTVTTLTATSAGLSPFAVVDGESASTGGGGSSASSRSSSSDDDDDVAGVQDTAADGATDKAADVVVEVTDEGMVLGVQDAAGSATSQELLSSLTTQLSGIASTYAEMSAEEQLAARSQLSQVLDLTQQVLSLLLETQFSGAGK